MTPQCKNQIRRFVVKSTHVWIFALISLFGCSTKIEVERINGSASSASATRARPITAKPGETVYLSGTKFNSTKNTTIKITTADGSKITAPVSVSSDTEASFVMPAGAGLGLTSLTVESDGVALSGSINFIANQASNNLDIFVGEPSEICSTKQYIDRAGATKTGTKTCSAPPSSTPTTCASDGASNCLVDGTNYVATAVASLTAGNIKSGVTIAGVTGQFPNGSYPLSGASGTADLTAATFNAKIKSSTAFEFWDSTGSRQTGTGDANILATNIANGISIFGTTGTLTVASPSTWDLRAGVTLGSVTGKLPTNCRNTANHNHYNFDGDITTLSDNLESTGTAIDLWDTIDDYNNNTSGVPTEIVTGWSTATSCGGIEATTDDSNVWRDVTTTGDGVTLSTCAASSANCSYKDKISGLEWSKQSGSTATWPAAINYCDGLTFNGKTDWRLPTEKELIAAYEHGIRSTESVNFVVSFGTLYFSSTSSSVNTAQAWALQISNGLMDTYHAKTTTWRVICVRP